MKQKSLFPPKQQLVYTEKEAVEFLTSLGYELKKPNNKKKGIVSAKYIIEDYYEKLSIYYKDEFILPSPFQEKQDLESLKQFYAISSKHKYKKLDINSYLQESIKILFEVVGSKEIPYPPKTFSSLLHQSWILEKVRDFVINRKKQYLIEQRNKACYIEDDKLLFLRKKREESILGDQTIDD